MRQQHLSKPLTQLGARGGLGTETSREQSGGDRQVVDRECPHDRHAHQLFASGQGPREDGC
jgi:hypothetical protein